MKKKQKTKSKTQTFYKANVKTDQIISSKSKTQSGYVFLRKCLEI